MMISTKAPTTQGPERALLVALERPSQSHWDLQESLRELAQLVSSAGGEVMEQAVQKRSAPTAPYYIGKGKAHELAAKAKELEITTIVFDDELTPAQSRNLEKVFERKILDRTQLILDIFAQRAQTREGKLQIELAQLQYLLPRLTGMWTHLSRQSGGIGTRGPGETQLEVDRRRVQEKIARLKGELDQVRRHRSIQRKGRQRHQWPMVAMVGYTNAGKSTLLNRLTKAEVYAADQLFATLDPTTRKLMMPNKQTVLLSDTVGFLQKLPHHLVESFKATLEEVKEADLLLHVIDLSHPLFEAQMEAVDLVLDQLEALQKPILLVFNKIDQVEAPGLVERMRSTYPRSVAISAMEGTGMDQLFQEIASQMMYRRQEVALRLPQQAASLMAEIYRSGEVLTVSYRGNYIHAKARIAPPLLGRVQEYLVEEKEKPPVKAKRKTKVRAS